MGRIQLSNVSQAIGPERGGLRYYDWKVFVDEDPATLHKIDSVTYFLHPTFPEPVRTVSDENNKFALETKGWGEFEIRASIQYKDGTSESTSYHLDLKKGVPEVSGA